jgi:NADH:ubiquinone oxidoreductase subunit 3 (subunit A)
MSIILRVIIIILTRLINIQSNKVLNLSNPFESGFKNSSLPQKTFSVRYFSICLLFLIFDIEIILFIPITIIKTVEINIIFTIIILTLILIQGLIEE